MWEFVSGLLKNPEMLREGLEKMIEAEREGMRRDPAREAKAWLERIADVDRKRSRFQDMAAEGYITLDELGAKLRELNETRGTAQRELCNLEQRRARMEGLEQDKASLVEEFAGRIPEAIEELTQEDQHRVYRMLRLEVYVHPNGYLDVRGAVRGRLRIQRQHGYVVPPAGYI